MLGETKPLSVGLDEENKSNRQEPLDNFDQRRLLVNAKTGIATQSAVKTIKTLLKCRTITYNFSTEWTSSINTIHNSALMFRKTLVQP